MHSVTHFYATFSESVVLLSRAYGSWNYTDTYYYSCSSSSTSLTGCSKNSVSSIICNSNYQVGLWCMTLPQTGKHIYIMNACLLSILFCFFLVGVLKITIVLQYALVELFGWWEEHTPIKANWNTVTMEHGLLFVTLFMMKRLQ